MAERSKRGWPIYAAGLLALAVVVAATIKMWRERRAMFFGSETNAADRFLPVVATTVAAPAPAMRTLTLVGEADPYLSATLYAKVSGYLQDIRVDKGDRVSANELLATIVSPELDHEYQGAVADAQNKELNARRASILVKRDLIAQQEADQAAADATVARQNVLSLATMRSYETLRAPFAGIVTARYADPGALVQDAANAQTSALPVVTVAETGRLRVFIYPDQTDAYYIHVGDHAEIGLPGRPDVRLDARVSRTSGELDPRTRTLLTEIDFANRHGVILPGSFVQVTLRMPMIRRGGVEIPAEALVMRNDKPFVAAIVPGNRLAFRPVTLGDDDGVRVQVLRGLRPGERIATNVGDLLVDGERVQPVAAAGR
jgi:membrane fusion protein, multidrug efflux system